MTSIQQAGAQADAATGVGSQFELVFWQSVSASDDQQQLRAYLERYPTGTFASLARAKLAALARRFPGDAAPAQPIVPTAAVSAPAGPPAVTSTPVGPAPVGSVSGGPATAVVARLAIPAGPAPEPKPDSAEGSAPLPAVYAKPLTPAQYPGAPASTVNPPATAELSLAEQLRALSQSQGRRPPVVVSTITPTPPLLAPVPAVSLPGRFCSAEERNSFHDTSYRPAVEAATANNRTAIGHMEALRGLYDQAVERGDTQVANAVADASRAYASTAKTAYDERAAFDGMFKSLMSVPILDCGALK